MTIIAILDEVYTKGKTYNDNLEEEYTEAEALFDDCITKEQAQQMCERELLRLDHIVFGLLGDLALSAKGTEFEYKIEDLQALIEEKFAEVRNKYKTQKREERSGE